ncbi:MAG: hypothetical protein C4567_17755 [Deltaproteobacteria bacterium]|nr:MAG: hypothetical protein C4567_17755 [Deltaproteobacteria bacterium]
MKNLLVVSYLFPPLLSPESLLLLGRVRELARLGWKITALTIDPRATLELLDHRLEESLPPHLRVVRTGQALVPLYALPLPAKIFFKSLTLLGLPEMQFPWYLYARRPPRRLLDEGGFTAIYSHASHHVSNVVGLALKRFTGLPWVANFSDPWLDNPYLKFTPFQRPLVRALEKAIIREADAVIFVTSQTADAVMRKYPKEWRQRVHVIPHGFEAGILKDLDPAPHPRPRLRLVYTGSFYRGRRTPEGLFRGLQLLQRGRNLAGELEVRLLGPHVPPYQAQARSLGLDGVVACLGPVPFEESLKEAAAADVLLVIDAASDGPSLFLPSKLVDYIPFRKPILGLTPLAGASADVLRQLRCPIAPPDDPQAIARAVGTLLDLHHAGRLEVSPAYDAAAGRYDIRQTTKVLDGILDKISHKS